MILYHGTDIKHADNIISHGFDLTKCGTGFGTTFGNGIYLTPDINVAKCYGNTILKIKIKDGIKLHEIEKISPTSKHGKKKIKKIINDKIINGDYNGFIANSGEEVIIFNLNLIIHICKN